MQNFEYVIKDSLGIHARPAGMLVKLAGNYKSDIVFETRGRRANLKQIFDIMDLGARCRDTLEITVTGEDEDTAAAGVREFLEHHL